MPETINYMFWATTYPMTFAQFLAAKPRLTPIRYDDRDDALGAARNALKQGLSVHLIEGDDGTKLKLADIRDLIETPGALDGRPKKS
jgi:hypothetical protein